tara:strand:+ start:69 stop:1541 length:1473 start_codon:yes stop_codon:yes gene_type:complete
MDPKQIAITEQKNRNKTFQAGLDRMKKERDKEAKAKKKEEDEREAKSVHEQKKIALMQMNNIDEKEAQTRLEFQQRVESQEALLKQMADEIGEGYQDDARYQLRAKSLEEEKEIEKKRVDDQQKDALELIADKLTGLKESFNNYVGETPVFMQGVGIALGLFLLGQFLTSDVFKGILDYLINEIVPAFTAFYRDIQNFEMSWTGIFSLLYNNFAVILGILFAFKPRLLYRAVAGIISGIKFIYTDLNKTAVFAGGSKIKKALSLLRLGFVNVGKGISRAAITMLGYVKKFMIMLLANPIGLIIAAIAAAIGAVVYYFDDIKNYVNELGGIGNLFAVAVGAIKDGFARVGNFFIKLSNKLFGTEFEEFETDNFKKANEKRKLDAARYRIEKQAAEKEKEEADKKKKHADEQMAAGNQVRDIENEAMGKNEQSAEDMLAGALDKLGALSGAQQPSVINVDNSVRDNSSSSNTSVSNENIEDSDFAKALGYMA